MQYKGRATWYRCTRCMAMLSDQEGKKGFCPFCKGTLFRWHTRSYNEEKEVQAPIHAMVKDGMEEGRKRKEGS